MNLLAVVAGVVTLGAFLVHTIVGGRELAQVAPADGSAKAVTVRHQVVNGWHWVAVDLLLAGGGLVAVGVADLPGERGLLAGIAVYFAAVGTVWLGSTLIRARDRVLALGQWILCFGIAALAWLAR